MSTTAALSLPAASSATAGDANPLSRISEENQASGDRFLKLLVTQLKNQDPLNPMDNAQLTSQMAQINTVAGIEKLNESVSAMSGKLSSLDPSTGFGQMQDAIKGLSSQYLQSQTLQGAALVGREVWVSGSALAVRDGQASGGFELAGAADNVSVDILSAAGKVIDTVELGAQATGRGTFSWKPPEGSKLEDFSFRVSARSGAAAVKASAFSIDRVESVVAGPDGLSVQLARNGLRPLASIKAVS